MSLSLATQTARPALTATHRRAALLAILALGLAAGFVITSPAETASAIHRAGPDLTRLLRGMALLKTAMLTAAAGAILWRFGTPVPRPWFAAYAAALGAMALGPGLVWGMYHLYLGSAAMNGGLIATLILLWRDPGVGLGLDEALRRRRARI